MYYKFNLSFCIVDLTIMNLQVTRINASTIRVMWDALSPAPVGGYEVFYQVDGGDILSAGITTNIELAITGVTMQQEISCFVVAFGGNNTLPSDRSNVAVIQPGKLVHLQLRVW